jgi:predicted ATPase
MTWFSIITLDLKTKASQDIVVMIEEKDVPSRDHYVTSVEIEGLWGYRDVPMKLKPDVNFLIGGNGCGKTTIINLISYAVVS